MRSSGVGLSGRSWRFFSGLSSGEGDFSGEQNSRLRLPPVGTASPEDSYSLRPDAPAKQSSGKLPNKNSAGLLLKKQSDALII